MKIRQARKLIKRLTIYEYLDWHQFARGCPNYDVNVSTRGSTVRAAIKADQKRYRRWERVHEDSTG